MLALVKSCEKCQTFSKQTAGPVKIAKCLKSVRSLSVNVSCSLVKKKITYIFSNFFEAKREFTLCFPLRLSEPVEQLLFYPNQLCLSQMVIYMHSFATGNISNVYFCHICVVYLYLIFMFLHVLL